MSADDKHVMHVGDEKFTAIVGISQWITPNTCAHLGAGSKEYEIIQPPVSDNEAAFVHPMFNPETPSGRYLGKAMQKIGTWVPPGGYKYKDEPSVSIKELSKR